LITTGTAKLDGAPAPADGAPPPPPHPTNTAAAAGSKANLIAFLNINDLSDEKITDQSILLMRFSFGNKIL